jgi:hypothetical protein
LRLDRLDSYDFYHSAATRGSHKKKRCEAHIVGFIVMLHIARSLRPVGSEPAVNGGEMFLASTGGSGQAAADQHGLITVERVKLLPGKETSLVLTR